MSDETSPSSSDFIIEQKNSFKLIKNTKGYFWEIKVIDEDPNALIAQVEKLDKLAREKWESKS